MSEFVREDGKEPAVDIAIAVQISGYFQGDIMVGVRGFAGQSDVEIDLVAASAL